RLDPRPVLQVASADHMESCGATGALAESGVAVGACGMLSAFTSAAAAALAVVSVVGLAAFSVTTVCAESPLAPADFIVSRGTRRVSGVALTSVLFFEHAARAATAVKVSKNRIRLSSAFGCRGMPKGTQ